ncbi:MAG TPA: hypothetical protein VK859_08020, partial [bacterium]|nr:hypothetical protein [bacterium]
MSLSNISAGKNFLRTLLLFLSSAAPLFAQTSITINDGGNSTAGNLYEAVTFINATSNGGNVTLGISGSNLVTLGQALPTVSQSLTFLATGTDQALGIVGENEAESAMAFNQNLGLGNGVTLSLTNDGTGGTGNLDGSISVGGTLSLGAGSNFSLTAAPGGAGANGTAGTNGAPGGPGGTGGTASPGGLGGNGGDASVTAATL